MRLRIEMLGMYVGRELVYWKRSIIGVATVIAAKKWERE